MKESKASATSKTRKTGGKARKTRPADGGVASVDRALQILTLFRYADKPLTLADISFETNLYKSTLLRLFQSLERFDFLEKTEDGKYKLGIAIQHLGSVARSNFSSAEEISLSLRSLTSQTLESAGFYVKIENKRLCLYRVDSPQTVRASVAVGETLPLEVGAAGHILTAFSDGWKPTLRSRIVVKTLGERNPDLAALASPVFGANDTLVGALSLAGPVNRFTTELVLIASEALVKEAAKLATHMGASKECVEFIESYRHE